MTNGFAVAGAILGIYRGANKLPVEMTQQVFRVNREELDMDLEELAKQMSDWVYDA